MLHDLTTALPWTLPATVKTVGYSCASLDHMGMLQRAEPPHVVGTCPPKSKWPELVGKTAEEAEAVVKDEAPDVKIQVWYQQDHSAACLTAAYYQPLYCSYCLYRMLPLGP